MDSITLFVTCVNTIIASLTFAIVWHLRVAPKNQDGPAERPRFAPKPRFGTKVKPVVTDDTKEFFAEQREINSRPRS